jgi:hypothetical protein
MSVSRSALVVLGLAAVVGCKEQITTPGQCPALCPSTRLQLADTLLTTADVSDTSVRGYVLVREASYLLTANLDSLKSVVLIRFSKRDSTWVAGTDTAHVGKQDSVQLTLQVLQRDTSVKQLRLVIYRLPARFDTAATYASILPYLADSDLVDTVAIPDSVAAGAYAFRIADSLPIPPGDSGVVSLAVGLLAAGKTALTFGSGNGSYGTSAPALSYYVHARAPVDSLSKVFGVLPFVSLFVMSPPPGQPPPGELAIGGIPTARATLRLSLPKVVVDSNAVVRATLLLNTVSAAGGFANDSFFVIAQPVVRDFGIKSVLWPDSSVSGKAVIHQGQTGPVEMDVAPILRFWGTTTGDSTPRLIVMRVYPEGAILGSVSLAGRAAGAAGPQLRVTYVKPYAFGVP